MKSKNSLRRRWLLNTVGVASALLLALVVLVTVLFAWQRYSHTLEDMRSRAQAAAAFFAEFPDRSAEDFYGTCSSYAEHFSDSDAMNLQFIERGRGVVAASDGSIPTLGPDTPEIDKAMETRDIASYIGPEKVSGIRVLAVSAPMIYSNGEVVGVLRFVMPCSRLNGQVLMVSCFAAILLGLFCVVMLLFSNHYIRSILEPVVQITEKAKKIAGGTYGIQIKTKYHDEIGELANTINELSAQIARNEKLQTEFISSLSHELRTPLTAITGWSETLIDDETMDPETLRGMKIILREAKRLTEMVVDLLDFTRMQGGRMTLNVAPADIRSEFEDTVFMYSSRLSQDGVQLDYLDSDDEVPEITCDAKRLRQVFLNILDNAAKHGGEGKRIEASMAFEEGFVVVRIRDFGPGIPEDEIPLVKKKFYKGSSKARGTGIGLAVSDEIVQMHGGELILSNAPGGGTLVTVKLPAAQ